MKFSFWKLIGALPYLAWFAAMYWGILLLCAALGPLTK